MTTVAVSSFSLVRVLGSLHVDYRDESGTLQEHRVDIPQEHTLEDFISLAKSRLGVDAVEICQIQLEFPDAERIASLRSALDTYGVRLLTVPIDTGDLSGGTAEQRAEDIARIERWIDVAAQLGARFVRVNAGAPSAAEAVEDRDGLVDALIGLSEAAQRRGLELLIENHGGLSSDPEYMLEIRERVGPERIGILLDLGNFEPLISFAQARLAGVHTEDKELDVSTIYESIAKLAPVARLVHAKAHDPASDGTPLLDLDRALRIVSDCGYDGPVSVEWEGVLGDPWEQAAGVVTAVRKSFADAAAKRA